MSPIKEYKNLFQKIPMRSMNLFQFQLQFWSRSSRKKLKGKMNVSIQQDKEILARREKYLEDAKKEIDQARNDLDVREIKILQVEPLLPLARQMQELSLGFDDIIP